MVATRWCFKSRLVNTVHEYRTPIIHMFKIITGEEDITEGLEEEVCETEDEEDTSGANFKDPAVQAYGAPLSKKPKTVSWDSKDVVLAKGFLGYLEDIKFVFLLKTFHNIFGHTDQMYNVLQKKH